MKLYLHPHQLAVLHRDREFVLRALYLGYTFGVIETYLDRGTFRERFLIADDADFLGYKDGYFTIEVVK